MTGMDSGAIRTLAGHIRGQADGITHVVSAVDRIVSQLGQSWHGSDASEFIGWWQQTHRPSLIQAEQTLAGLAQSADNNAGQQDAASGVAGLVASGAAISGAASGAFAGALAFSNRFGFAAGPLLTEAPKVGGTIDGVMKIDQAARLAQDVGTGHYQAAFNQSSDMAASSLMGKHTPVTFLAGTDVIIAQHAEQAYRAVNWSYTVHHLSQLDPLAPGAFHAVVQAEAQGLKSLGVDWLEHSVGSFL